MNPANKLPHLSMPGGQARWSRAPNVQTRLETFNFAEENRSRSVSGKISVASTSAAGQWDSEGTQARQRRQRSG